MTALPGAVATPKLLPIALLAAACARPGCDLTADDLLSACHRGEAQLVGIFDGARLVAAGVTQVRELADRSRTCWVLAVGGAEAKAWRHTLREIEAGARRLGCGRHGAALDGGIGLGGHHRIHGLVLSV